MSNNKFPKRYPTSYVAKHMNSKKSVVMTGSIFCEPDLTSKDLFLKFMAHDHIDRILFQREKGKENGTEHWQFTFHTKIQRSWSYWMRQLKFNWKKGHWIDGADNADKCWNYASKSDTRIEGPWEIFMNVRHLNNFGNRCMCDDCIRSVSRALTAELLELNDQRQILLAKDELDMEEFQRLVYRSEQALKELHNIRN